MFIAFATGSGRCGTQTFGAQMQRLEHVVGLHEGRHQAYLGYRNPPKAPHLVCGSDQARSWNARALQIRRELFMKGEAQVGFGEGAHYLALNLDLVAEVFCDAKIVHLVRDPFDQVASMMQHAGPEVYGQPGGLHHRNETEWKRWPDCFPIYDGATTRAEGLAH